MDKNKYPSGLDAQKVKELIGFYDQQTDEEIAAEVSLASDEVKSGEGALSPLTVEELEEEIARLPVAERLLLVTRVVERIRVATP